MNVRYPAFSTLALVICLALLIPPDVAAQAAQSAGKITAVVPIVNVVRGPQQVAASTSQQVFWGDVINTGHLARARVALDDGSILSVGSDTNLAIAKHDAAEQQTDLDLNYGRVRAKAAKLVKPDAHFQIRTPVGVAGVVGTDVAVIYDSNGVMQVFCIEGKCRVCDVKKPLPNCVLLLGGQQSSVRSNEMPSQPAQATPMNMMEAQTGTSISGAGAAGGGIGAAGGVAVGVTAGIVTTVAVVVVRVVTKTQSCGTPPPTGTGVHSNCTKIDGVGKINGQRGP
jgi:hypothetical protein